MCQYSWNALVTNKHVCFPLMGLWVGVNNSHINVEKIGKLYKKVLIKEAMGSCTRGYHSKMPYAYQAFYILGAGLVTIGYMASCRRHFHDRDELRNREGWFTIAGIFIAAFKVRATRIQQLL